MRAVKQEFGLFGCLLDPRSREVTFYVLWPHRDGFDCMRVVKYEFELFVSF